MREDNQSPPEFSMGSPPVGVRQYLSAEHLWNAQHMAWRCRDRQDALAAAGFEVSTCNSDRLQLHQSWPGGRSLKPL